MKTTIELPDHLYRRAKAEAALSGRRLKDLIEDGLRLILTGAGKRRRKRSLAELMKGACGVVDSGIPDLASNPDHLADFGPRCAPQSLIPAHWSHFLAKRTAITAGLSIA